MFKWIIISLLLQVILLSMAERLLVPEDSQPAQVAKYEDEKDLIEPHVLSVPMQATSILLSHEGEYVAYLLEGKLEIISLAGVDKDSVVVLPQEDEWDMGFYRWMPDRNMVVYSCVKGSNPPSSNIINIITYDVDSGISRNCPPIAGLPEGSRVTGIGLSPFTRAVYIEIMVSSNEKSIYKFDIADKLSNMVKVGLSTIVKGLYNSDRLVLQEDDWSLCLTGGNNGGMERIVFKERIKLLGVDENDTLYIGKLDESGLIASISLGRLQNSTYIVQDEIVLEKAFLSQNILVTYSGSIYGINRGEKAIYNIRENIKTSMEGIFLHTVDDCAVSKGTGGKLHIIPLK